MNFASLCDFLETLRNTKGASEKAKLTKTFFTSAKSQGEDAFSVLRLITPKLDRDRPSYRIKESKISKLLVRMLGLPQGSDKNLLLKAVTGNSIDFGDIVHTVLKKYIVNNQAGLTLKSLNAYLDKIANRTSDHDLDDLLLEIFRQLSPTNTKWLIQIILKDLKLGFSDNSVLNAYHPDGASFYATNNNLKKVCEVLHDSQIKLHELAINIFEAFKPMLSKRCDAGNFKKCFAEGKPFLIENKFDGERFQLHMADGNFKYFSRNGFDFTDSYGASYSEGKFTPLLRNVFSQDAKRVILDGEMMLWNTRTQNFGSKGMNLDVKKLGKAGKYQPCLCVFDILLHNDKILTNQPLHKRLDLLKHVIENPRPGTLVLSEIKLVQTRDDIVAALNASVDNNEEGIVVKDPKSIYKCSDRNSGWFKIKMEYFDDVVHDLDVIIMGGNYGSGNKLNSFTVGVQSGTNTYLSLGRISSGLNAEQLDILSDIFKTHGVAYAKFSQQTQGQLFFGKETPDLYIEPQNSCLLQIRATELIRTASDAVKCPYTLRFPRVLKIRDDKPVDQCLTMNELLDLTSQNKAVIKLNKRHIELDEVVTKTRPRKRVKLEIVNMNQHQDLRDFLQAKRFYVHSAPPDWGIEEIYYCIKKAGGQASYRLEPQVDVVLVAQTNGKIAEVIKQPHHFDVVRVDWFRRVVDAQMLLDYDQGDIISLGSNFKRDFSLGFDRYGDSFGEEVTRERLERIMELMEQNDEFFNTNGAVTWNKD